jgi:DNA-binding transcriptional ArsR family regulator
VRRAGYLGRYGWLNLVGLVVRGPRPWDLDHLLAAVRVCAPVELHFVAVGGDRRQLLDAVEEAVVRAAVDGDPAARRRLDDALDSDEHVLEVAPWLLNSASADVREAILAVLQTWRERLLPPQKERVLAAELHEAAEVASAELTGATAEAFLHRATGGLRYDPAALGRVLAVPSPRVAPVIVAVDGREARVILHPPLGSPAQDPSARLVELGRAVGDGTRMRLLTSLRDGEMTAVELARAMGAPRTTLLHHLAILRAAGLIRVRVTPGEATVYRLERDGFRELAMAAAAFMPIE